MVIEVSGAVHLRHDMEVREFFFCRWKVRANLNCGPKVVVRGLRIAKSFFGDRAIEIGDFCAIRLVLKAGIHALQRCSILFFRDQSGCAIHIRLREV